MRTHINRILLSACLVSSFVPQALSASVTLKFKASESQTVQVNGPRTGGVGKNYFNAEGNGGKFPSFGVLHFDLLTAKTPSPVRVVQSATLVLTQSNAKFTSPGSFKVYLAVGKAATAKLIYKAANAPEGIGTQLGKLIHLGSAKFSATADTKSGQTDKVALTLNAESKKAFVAALNTASSLRIVVTPADSKVAATWAGAANTKYAAPSLTFSVKLTK